MSMEKFLIMFYYKGKKVCSCWKEGKDKEDAVMNAEWALVCKYPDVLFDEVSVCEEDGDYVMFKEKVK